MGIIGVMFIVSGDSVVDFTAIRRHFDINLKGWLMLVDRCISGVMIQVYDVVS